MLSAPASTPLSAPAGSSASAPLGALRQPPGSGSAFRQSDTSVVPKLEEDTLDVLRRLRDAGAHMNTAKVSEGTAYSPQVSVGANAPGQDRHSSPSSLSSYQSASTSFDRSWSSRSSATSPLTEASNGGAMTHEIWELRQQMNVLQAEKAALTEQSGRIRGMPSESTKTQATTAADREQKAMDDEIRGEQSIPLSTYRPLTCRSPLKTCAPNWKQRWRGGGLRRMHSEWSGSCASWRRAPRKTRGESAQRRLSCHP